ncbi:hypothetical protein AVEN_33838-1, partial [Araneus ventricosus]
WKKKEEHLEPSIVKEKNHWKEHLRALIVKEKILEGARGALKALKSKRKKILEGARGAFKALNSKR